MCHYKVKQSRYKPVGAQVVTRQPGPKLLKRLGFRLVILGAFFRVAAPYSQVDVPLTHPTPNISTGIFIRVAAPVQFGIVSPCRLVEVRD